MKRFYSLIDLRSWLLCLGTFFVCLILGEVVIRWYMFGENAWSYAMMRSVRHIGKSGLLQASPIQEILWELRPNLNTIYKLKPFTTNASGLRDKEYSLTKAEGTFRVAVIGDSFTMGEGVGDNDGYHAQLEERFNARGDGRRYEFINFGVAGYSLVQYLATIRHKVINYQPDLVLIGFCAANDSKLPNLAAFNEPYRVKPIGNGFFNFYSLEWMGNVYKDIYKSIRGRYSGYNADADYVDREFRNLAELSTRHELPIVIAYIDNKAASSDLEMIRSASERYGFGFIDATTNFPPKVIPEYIIYATDKHPNGAANKVIAENLYSKLQTLPSFRAVQ